MGGAAREEREGALLRRLLRGTGRGVLGAMAMSGARQLLVGLGLIERTPPEAVLAEGVPSVLHGVPERRRTAVIELAHWGYGGAAGAVYSLLPAGLRRRHATGPVYGVLIWAVFEAGVAPLLDLAHAHRSRPAERVALLCDHVLYGLALGVPPEKPAPGKLPEKVGGKGAGGAAPSAERADRAGKHAPHDRVPERVSQEVADGPVQRGRGPGVAGVPRGRQHGR